MLRKPTKKRKTTSKRRNPSEALDLFNKMMRTKDKSEKRKSAQKLKLFLSDDPARYWQIIRTHVNLQKDDIKRLIEQSINPVKSRKNPILGINTGEDIVIKHRGNKIVFNGEDADELKELIRKEYSDNSDIRNILV